MSEISLKGTIYDMSVDPSPIKKEDVLNIHKYVIKKNNLK